MSFCLGRKQQVNGTHILNITSFSCTAESHWLNAHHFTDRAIRLWDVLHLKVIYIQLGCNYAWCINRQCLSHWCTHNPINKSKENHFQPNTSFFPINLRLNLALAWWPCLSPFLPFTYLITFHVFKKSVFNIIIWNSTDGTNPLWLSVSATSIYELQTFYYDISAHSLYNVSMLHLQLFDFPKQRFSQ